LLGWAKTCNGLNFGRPMGIHGSHLKPESTPEIKRVWFGQTHRCKTAPKPTPIGSETRRAPEPMDPIAIPNSAHEMKTRAWAEFSFLAYWAFLDMACVGSHILVSPLKYPIKFKSLIVPRGSNGL
jgi:hypothetical protein